MVMLFYYIKVFRILSQSSISNSGGALEMCQNVLYLFCYYFLFLLEVGMDFRGLFVCTVYMEIYAQVKYPSNYISFQENCTKER